MMRIALCCVVGAATAVAVWQLSEFHYVRFSAAVALATAAYITAANYKRGDLATFAERLLK